MINEELADKIVQMLRSSDDIQLNKKYRKDQIKVYKEIAKQRVPKNPLGRDQKAYAKSVKYYRQLLKNLDKTHPYIKTIKIEVKVK